MIPTVPTIEQFEATLPFSLDDFQIEAMGLLDSAQSLLVSAPTSSGKTLIAEYAIWKALQDQPTETTVIYTTPLKALSNQKYHELQDRYGESSVGLVTGEHSVNDAAPILVMTTEILRNIAYEEPARLRPVRDVILDEIHFIDEYPRGTVWEELIIELPETVRLIGLSATVSNVDELAKWMTSLRGSVTVVHHPHRPVQLVLSMATGNHLYPMYGEDGKKNPVLMRHLNQPSRVLKTGHGRTEDNTILELIPALHRAGMTPAIYFIFSRKGCREALERCARSALTLTTREEQAEIRQEYDEWASRLSSEEITLFEAALQRETLARGLAMHHAGMLPAAKECVEHCFQKGLVKVVFATETLSLGLNMPAKSCVISSFTKFDGEGFHPLTSTQVTQLLGRAGRRGIDTIGYGVILKDREVDADTIFEAASGENMTVSSKFTPTYAMALNLLLRHSYEQSIHLLEKSFGQFQTVERLSKWGDTENRLIARRDAIADRRFRHPVRPCSEKTLNSYARQASQLQTLLRERRRYGSDHGRGPGRHGKGAPPALIEYRRKVNMLRKELAKSPCTHCPFFQEHDAVRGELREIDDRLRNEMAYLESEKGRFKDEFGRMTTVLRHLGFIDGEDLTGLGRTAAALFGDRSLVIAKAIEDGTLSPLSPEEFAVAISMLVAEERSDRGSWHIRLPTEKLERIANRFTGMLRAIDREEQRVNLSLQRGLALEHAHGVFAWASGIPLENIALPEGTDIGDLIRLIKNAFAMIRQIEHVVRGTPLHDLARRSRESLERDVITRI